MSSEENGNSVEVITMCGREVGPRIDGPLDEGIEWHEAFGPVDPKAVSPTTSSDSNLALRTPAVVSDLGTPSRTDEVSVTTCQLATLAQLWLHLPADLRAAILLMVQPWAHSNSGNAHASLNKQGDPA